MSVLAQRVAISTAAVRLSPASADFVPGSSLAVKNIGTVPVYLGASNVTTSTGFPLDAGESVGIDLAGVYAGGQVADEQLWAIAASSTTVATLVTGV